MKKKQWTHCIQFSFHCDPSPDFSHKKTALSSLLLPLSNTTKMISLLSSSQYPLHANPRLWQLSSLNETRALPLGAHCQNKVCVCAHTRAWAWMSMSSDYTGVARQCEFSINTSECVYMCTFWVLMDIALTRKILWGAECTQNRANTNVRAHAFPQCSPLASLCARDT